MKDARKIQEVLRLHVRSARSMYETYERLSDVDGCRYEKGVIDGLERAIEVADYREAREAEIGG